MLIRLCCCLLGLLALGGASAQMQYPQRPVTLVVPFAAGGDADQFARALVQSLSKITPTPDIRVENQPGKSGTLASLAVRQAPTDGYSLLVARVGTHAIQPTAGLPTGSAIPQHFDGGLQAVGAVVDGKADFVCAPSSSAASAIRSGKLRGLFTTTAGRMEAFPQIPNAREAGFRAMSNVVGWTALMGPVGLPAEVIRYWQKTLQKVAADPEWQDANATLGGQPAIRLITQPDRYVQEQFGLYQQLASSLKNQP